ncbi:uncharacterized protein FFE2_08921 [Fusarium fujikuroi]|nr:uncharacterized protein FFE2_08921 [Fusarium fujikuroi]SCO07078.1 uncharacterized protein FFC1_10309 [Fusarium fujikuroi]
MATYTEQLAYKQPTGAVATEVLSSPPTPWATYEDLPETPRATFTDQMPYLQSPVPAYMESDWPFSKARVANDQLISQVAENDNCVDASPISYLSDECNHCGCSDFGDNRAPPLEDMEFRRGEMSLSNLEDFQDDVALNSSKSVITCSPGSPIRPQQAPGVPGTSNRSGSSCRPDHGGIQSTAIAMTFQGLEALCMLQICMILHSTVSTRQPNIGLNRRIASGSTKSSSLVQNATGTAMHGMDEANDSQVPRTDMGTSSRKRKSETTLRDNDTSRSKRTKTNKRTASEVSFKLMELYLKDADSPRGRVKEWTYQWNNKYKAWEAADAPEGFQRMSGEQLYMFSEDLTFKVRPNWWMPVYMTRHGDEFIASDSIDSDWKFKITDDIMRLMLIWNDPGDGIVLK